MILGGSSGLGGLLEASRNISSPPMRAVKRARNMYGWSRLGDGERRAQEIQHAWYIPEEELEL